MNKKIRILIIDDNSLYWMYLRKALKVTAIEGDVVECGDVASGIEWLTDDSFDCIILDYVLPDGNGLAVLEMRRALNIPTPVIVLTGEGGEQIAVELMKAGASDYISKSSLTPERLAQSIKNVIYAFQIEKQIKRSEEILKKYQILSDYARDIILFIRSDGQILEANHSAVAAYGYSYEEMTSLNIQDLHYDNIDRQFEHVLDKANTDGILFETLHYRKDGSSFPVEVSSRGALIGNDTVVLSVIRDITLHKEADNLLRQSEEKYSSIFKLSRDVIFITNIDGLILDINQMGSEIYGYTGEEFQTMKIQNLYNNPDDRLDLLKEITQNGFVKDYPLTLKKRNGVLVLNLLTANIRENEIGHTIIQGILRDVTQSKIAEENLHHAHAQINHLLGSISSILIGVSSDDKINQWNSAAEKYFGITVDKVIGECIQECKIDWDWLKIQKHYSDCKKHKKPVHIENLHYSNLNKERRLLVLDINHIQDADGKNWGYVFLGTDVTEQKKLESQSILKQKMESIGQLAAGIAHEINTPMQYIGDNTRFLNDSFQGILAILKKYQNLINNVNSIGFSSELPSEIEKLNHFAKEIDLDYLQEEVPKAINESLEGINRVSNLVLTMKDFSHPGNQGKIFCDINNGIEKTVFISKHEWKYVADLEFEPQSELPMVYCAIDQINQVILNMIINSAHAVKEHIESGKITRGKIIIRTENADPFIRITIQDTGIGIPDKIVDKIFDPFFTTKEVGKGTGQGLSIAHDIIVNKHHGSIEVNSEAGNGATFIITLPIIDDSSARPKY
ncbi:PAS domain S-box protein [Dehalobacter sp. DCM]|uniref:hybrid sensor histidine kinase/response regulator n=1 Tax=Dehalobacter sp. DCM TaxID=2907827 RepID=UPI0030818D02|nr:PAS domain S-box protein [Dehalobacter sp. DCM]